MRRFQMRSLLLLVLLSFSCDVGVSAYHTSWAPTILSARRSLVHGVGVSPLRAFGYPRHVDVVVRSARSTVARRSSSGNQGGGGDDDDDDDDALSKLISKRSQIKRKRRDADANEGGDPTTVTVTGESIVDINLDALPEFTTERPVRRRRSGDDDDDDDDAEDNGVGDDDDEKDEGSTTAGGKKKKKDAAAPIVDFQADYDDENDFHIPNRMGVCTEAWGDPKLNFMASAGNKLTKRDIKLGKFVPGDVQLAHTKLLEGGITLFETSPAYGSASRPSSLSSEDILKRCLEEVGDALPETMLVETLSVTSLFSSLSSPASYIPNRLEESLGRLGGLATIELFQAPSRATLFSSRLLAAGLAAAIESGQCNHVGVTGVQSALKLRRIKRRLEARDVTLTSNMFEFSLTNRKSEKMIGACKALGVIPFICNPLDDGLSSGVFTATNPSGGQVNPSRKFTFQQLEKLQPLHSVLETVADRVRTRVIREMRETQDRYKSRYGPPPKINTDITTTQVALNYVIAKGGVPFPQVNTPKQAQEVLGCLGWGLNDDDVAMLDSAADLCLKGR
jgi:aryl-alcohol dehydrogenase-like predicted oxidoreductase